MLLQIGNELPKSVVQYLKKEPRSFEVSLTKADMLF